MSGGSEVLLQIQKRGLLQGSVIHPHYLTDSNKELVEFLRVVLQAVVE